MLGVVQFERPSCGIRTRRHRSDRDGLFRVDGNASGNLCCGADGHAVAVEPLESIGEILLRRLIAVDVDGDLFHIAVDQSFVDRDYIRLVLQPTIGDDLLKSPIVRGIHGVHILAAHEDASGKACGGRSRMPNELMETLDGVEESHWECLGDLGRLIG